MEHTISTDQHIINTMLLNASFIDNIGLMHGKMGISIFFFQLARQTKNQIFEDYADELIDEIYEEITTNTPVDFENGLAGIGWGIEYLVQNKFIEADTDEVLEEFDNRIFKELIYNTPKEIGLLNGIVGIGAYFLKRIQNPSSNNEKITTLTNKQTLIHVIDELERQTLDIKVIIKEPEARTEKLEPSNNQTFELSNLETKETFEPKPCFEITWNYPVLLWFLAELYQQNIFNFKVEKLIQRMIEPLSNNQNLPKLQSNRLLLSLTLTKLLQTLEHSNSQALELLNAETINTNLVIDLNRETIKSELLLNDFTIKHGASGIATIYQQLFELTADNRFKQEMEYWATQIFHAEKDIKNYSSAEESTNYKETVFGILEGKAGILLNYQTISHSTTKTIKH
jgi:lantibiotic modifying enzyme